MNGQVKIDELWAWTIIDPVDNTEGIPAAAGPSGETLPLVGADRDRIESLREIAQAAADHYHAPVTLSRYTTRTNIETLEPKP